MRLFLLIGLSALLLKTSFAQPVGQGPKPMVYSASSAWQKVILRSTPEPGPRRSSTTSTAPSTTFRPAFTGDFVTNRNHWRAGNFGDYHYQIGVGSYSVRKRNVRTSKASFSSVALPQEINLNRAEVFTIKLDVLADSGQVPTGGLLFGIKDSLNFCAFTTNSRGEVSIKRVANGETFTDYMPGEFFRPGVPIDKNRNRLMVKRRGEYLYFFINEQEVRSSPYPFRMLSGNGIGLTSSGYWTSFQKLTVTVGL
ncbi:hypothetical protein IC230_23910 [Spirosoma sp. BT704]|uniref:Uncharacterized protein n=2 Tax=Spirosoma validum TaxID=2771355 RepID=A0A927GFV2_9BACT|nr:hypothetical protein [Spirosoma validum]